VDKLQHAHAVAICNLLPMYPLHMARPRHAKAVAMAIGFLLIRMKNSIHAGINGKLDDQDKFRKKDRSCNF
jgi:hypothetical protein